MPPKPQNAPDYTQWPTKQQTAAILQCSTKSVEAFAQAGKIQSFQWRRPSGGPKIAVYHPGDVERLRLDRSPGTAPTFVMPATSAIAPRSESKVEAKGDNVRLLQLFQALLQDGSQKLLGTSQNSRKPEVPLQNRIYLTVRESAAYVGWPERRLREMIAAGQLKADTEGYTRVRRSDLDKL